MGWLMRGDQVLATVELARSFRDRSRGLIGLDGYDGAYMITPCKAIHTIGVRFPIDVAFCTRDLVVVDLTTMKPNRLGMARWKAHSVLEAEAGSFEKWNLKVGDSLEIRP